MSSERIAKFVEGDSEYTSTLTLDAVASNARSCGNHGCVTSGEVWQFLRLEQNELIIDRTRLFLDNVGGILAVLQAIIRQNQPGDSSGSAAECP